MEYFIVGSQTCDISGEDGPPKQFACVLAVGTLAHYLANERLPIGIPKEEADQTKWSTILDYLVARVQPDLADHRNDEFRLPEKVRQTIKDWQPKTSKEKDIRGRIKNILHDLLNDRKEYFYYLPRNDHLTVPEGYVEFFKLYTIPTSTLQDLTEFRIATLRSPYKEHFSRKLGNFFSRIATPAICPPSLK